MTAASVFLHQQSSDGAKGETRAQEPSMEDILASIRRIIADDQLHAQRPAYGGSRRAGPTQPAVDAGSSQRMQDARGGYDDILDLARMRGTATPEREAPRQTTERREPPTTAPAAPSSPDASAAAMPASSAPWTADQRGRPTAEAHYEEPEAEEGYEVDAEEASAENGVVYEQVEPAVAAESGPGRALSTERRDPGRQEHPAAAGGEALISAKPGASVMSAFETLAATVVLQNGEMLERIMRDELRPMIKSWLDDNLPTMVERLVRSEIERVARGGRS